MSGRLRFSHLPTPTFLFQNFTSRRAFPSLLSPHRHSSFHSFRFLPITLSRSPTYPLCLNTLLRSPLRFRRSQRPRRVPQPSSKASVTWDQVRRRSRAAGEWEHLPCSRESASISLRWGRRVGSKSFEVGRGREKKFSEEGELG